MIRSASNTDHAWILDWTITEWGDNSPESPDTPCRRNTHEARKVRIGPDGAFVFTAVTRALKKEPRKVQEKLWCALIIAKDDEIMGVVEEVYVENTL